MYLKTKKMTDISQTQAGFQGFLTQNPDVFVEIEDSFDFSDTPQADSCEEGQDGYTNI